MKHINSIAVNGMKKSGNIGARPAALSAIRAARTETKK